MGIRVKLVAVALLGAATLAVPVSAAPQESVDETGEKLICKKQLETGSLVKKRKTCMTKAQWEKVAHSQQDGSRRMVEGLAGRCGDGETGCGF